ncbi:MAG: BolA/IbaG family iron-sulfur metabolism protein [Pseudomonadota bacterium]|nr:BolA/IbaG family iron-sulfur metabolism protein [Pseudomonadota bacterium]
MHEIIKKILSDSFNIYKIEVGGTDAKYDVTIITDDFAGKNTIERHKMVYALLNKFIETGEIHALTIRSLTKDEDEES